MARRLALRPVRERRPTPTVEAVEYGYAELGHWSRGRCRRVDRLPRPCDRDGGRGKEHVLASTFGENGPTRDSSRLSLLETGLGETVGGRMAREATGPPRGPCVDRRRQRPRDARPSARTSRDSRSTRHALVDLRRPSVSARASKAGRRNSRRLRRFGYTTAAGRVAADWGRVAPSPFGDRASACDDRSAWKPRGATRDPVETGSSRVPQQC